MNSYEDLEKLICKYQKKDNSIYKKKLTDIKSFYLTKPNIFFQYDNIDTSFVAENFENYTNKQICLD